MAGRLMVIRFDDRDAAAMFEVNEHIRKQLGFKLLGVYVLPTVFCECPETRGRKPGRVHNDNWAKGRRTGIWICRTCKRPSRFYMRGLMSRLEGVFGYNQLATEDE